MIPLLATLATFVVGFLWLRYELRRANQEFHDLERMWRLPARGPEEIAR